MQQRKGDDPDEFDLAGVAYEDRRSPTPTPPRQTIPARSGRGIRGIVRQYERTTQANYEVITFVLVPIDGDSERPSDRRLSVTMRGVWCNGFVRNGDEVQILRWKRRGAGLMVRRLRKEPNGDVVEMRTLTGAMKFVLFAIALMFVAAAVGIKIASSKRPPFGAAERAPAHAESQARPARSVPRAP